MELQNVSQIFQNPERTISGATNTVQADDYILLCDTSAGIVNVELLEIPNKFDREYKLYIIDVSGNAATNNITINAPAGHLINGDASVTIDKDNGNVILRFVKLNSYSAVGLGGGGGADTTIYDRDGVLTAERRLTFGGFNLGFIGTDQFGVGVEPNAVGVSTVTTLGVEVNTPEVQFHVASHIRTDGWYYTRYGRVLHQLGPIGQTNGIANLFVGYRSGNVIDGYTPTNGVEGTRNTGLGAITLLNLTSGYSNTIVGGYAGREITVGHSNTAIGESALNELLDGNQNTAVGIRALGLSCVSGNNNTAIGEQAGETERDFNGNTYVGSVSGNNGMGGDYNTGVGYGSLRGSFSNPSFPIGNEYNIAIGYRSGWSFQENNLNNIFIGKNIGFNVGGTVTSTGTSGLDNLSDNIMIGYDHLINADSIVKSISIAADLDNSNEIRIGNITDHTSAEIPVAWTVTSDERFKNISTDSVPGLEFVKQLNPIKYKLKDRETGEDREVKNRYGFSAQDIVALEGADKIISDDSDLEHLKLRESMIIPTLVNAIKELEQQIVDLKSNNNLN